MSNNLKQSRNRVIPSVLLFIVIPKVSYYREVNYGNLRLDGYSFSRNANERVKRKRERSNALLITKKQEGCNLCLDNNNNTAEKRYKMSSIAPSVIYVFYKNFFCKHSNLLSNSYCVMTFRTSLTILSLSSFDKTIIYK